MAERHCSECGKKLEDDAIFCPKCGAVVKRSPVEPGPGLVISLSGIVAAAGLLIVLAGLFVTGFSVLQLQAPGTMTSEELTWYMSLLYLGIGIELFGISIILIIKRI